MSALSPIAVVDVGSNSLHLQIVAGDDTLASGRSAVKLGDFVDGGLRPAAIDGALEALASFHQQAQALGCVAFRASATAAVREANNAAVLLDRARHELGLDVRVLSGLDEARLAWRGAQRGLGFDAALVFDLGGRSTELCDGDWAVSLPLGHLSATAAGSRAAVEARVARMLADLDVPSAPRLVGCAGTALTLGQMAAAARGEPFADRHDKAISRDELSDLVDQLVRTGGADMPGVDRRRLATLPLGAAAVLALVDGLGFDRLTTSESALRDGLVQELSECSSP